MQWSELQMSIATRPAIVDALPSSCENYTENGKVEDKGFN